MEDGDSQVRRGISLWVSDPKEINRLQHIAVDESRLHIPILFRTGCDPWLSHDFSGADRDGVVLGSQSWWSQRRP